MRTRKMMNHACSSVAARWAVGVSLLVAAACGPYGCAADRKAQTNKPDQKNKDASGKNNATRADTVKPAKREVVDPIAASALRERALQAIESGSTDKDPAVRGNAVEAASLASARTIEIVRRGLRDESPGVRAIAAMAIGRSKLTDLKDDVRPLLNDTTEQAPYVQSSALFAMQKCGESSDLSPISDWLLRGQRASLRSHTAFLLGELGDPSAVPLLYQAAREPVPNAMSIEARLMDLQIAEALVKLGEQDQLKVMRAALYPSKPEDLEATALAVQILGQLQDRASITALIFLAERRDEAGNPMPSEIRLAVASALAKMGNPRGDFIADEHYKSVNPALRAQSAHVYGDTGKANNLSLLGELLDDPDAMVRVAAASAILKISRGSQRG